ncbi:DUF3800 domain-containing protein [Dyella flagellata]|uniref:DUF3800 domain-containing protein n=1 Tax=Dyella flagellata TaxID=1867833 RepID=A0ABQ5XEY5_9GAMM|nr:DUF3800 domain-containing protein [Dyella flagellata]GLQ89158.1 hypothetical protein GCM10007898_27300 [Dyella flagellata]
MHIFVDESGTFAKSKSRGSWCVVAAYAIPEAPYAKAKEVLRGLKMKCGVKYDVEIKRKDIDELRYFELLSDLSKIDGIGVAVATDASLNGGAEEHQEQQALKIEKYAPNMVYPEGRQMLLDLAKDLRGLSEQNYVELVCRVQLVYDVLQLAINYYAQRLPGTLSNFRWSFDGKDTSQNPFETMLQLMVGPLLQSKTLHEPFGMMDWADYSKMARFEFKGEAPWLPKRESNGRKAPAWNVGLIWREHLEFADSKGSPGVQLADFLASGLRALLRGSFHDNDQAALRLGACMVQRQKSKPGIHLIGLTPGEDIDVGPDVSRRVKVLARTARPMLAS